MKKIHNFLRNSKFIFFFLLFFFFQNEAYAYLTEDHQEVDTSFNDHAKKAKFTKQQHEKRMEWARNYARLKKIKEGFGSIIFDHNQSKMHIYSK